MRTIAVHTLGCKVNQYDSEAMLECFERAGYAAVEFSGDADVYLINTCTVTGTGDNKSMKLIRRVHREHPQSDIIVAGCLAQRDAAHVLLEGVRLVIGVQKRQQVVQLYEQAVAEGRSLNAVEELKDIPFEQLFISRHEGRTRATMKIQEGCDRYCAYCIIPSVRGPVRSMPVCEVRREAKRLAEAGYRELVVTGIHLGSFGRGTEETLIDAIRAVHDVPGVRRVRLGSIEPVTVTEEFARAVANMPGVCRQFHLSMQSGSAGVLKRMRRRYTPEAYMEAVERIRAVMPDAAITTDVIAGFPGETQAEHEETLAFVERVGFARIHVFPYSRRSGTIADKMPDQVPEAEKHRRAQELIELGNRLEERYVQSMEGSVREVLFEREGPDGLCEGYTGEYVRVRAAARAGEIRNVRILRREGTLTFGEAVD